MSLRDKRVMVTGGAGFIGSHLVDALLAEGAEKVVAIDNLFLGRLENLAGARAAGDRFDFVKQNIADTKAMRRLFGKHRVQVVFDLAVIPLPTSLQRPKWTIDCNVLGATALCELSRQGAFETLIHFSSSEALGTARQVPMGEDHPLEPITPYAASKAACDHIVLSYVRTFGLDAAILRPFNNYGPRQNDQAYAGIIPIVVRRVLAGQPVEIFGDGCQTRDFIFVEDTVRAAIAMVERPETRGQVTHVGSGRETAVNDLVRTMLHLLNAQDHPVVHGPPRPGDVRRHCADITRAETLLGFQPQVDMEEGLRRTIEWYLNPTTA